MDILHEAELILMAVRVKELEVRLCAICDNWNPGDFDYFKQTLALYEKTHDQAVALGWQPPQSQLPKAKYPCYKVDSLCCLARNGLVHACSYDPDTCPWRVRAEKLGKVRWQRFSQFVRGVANREEVTVDGGKDKRNSEGGKNKMENTQKGIAISSQHGKVDIAFTDILRQTNDENDSYITTITGPDQSVVRIITNGLEHGTYASKLRRAICTVLKNNPMWADVIHAMEDAQDNRRETALDEVKTADLWDKAEPRYWVTLIADEFDGYSEVPITLFHTEMSNEELARLVVLAPGRIIDDVAHWYTASAIEQTFSKAKVKQLYAYFKQRGNVRLRARRAYSPTNDSMGYGAYPVGGGNDFYTFSEEPGYSLPFKVWGYFDLRHINEK